MRCEHGDVVAVKAHGSPAFYAIEYLRGRLDREALEGLRTLRRAAGLSEPAQEPGGRGSLHRLDGARRGDGRVRRARHALSGRSRRRGRTRGASSPCSATPSSTRATCGRRCSRTRSPSWAISLWIVDMNRQSLDRVVPDARRGQLRAWFAAAGWHVIELRWGSRLRARFARPGGERLRARLEAMSNAEYHALLRLARGRGAKGARHHARRASRTWRSTGSSRTARTRRFSALVGRRGRP